MSEEKKETEAKKPLTLVQKLAAIQLELKAPKNQRNNFGGYNYRSAEDILEAVKPLAIKHGAVVRITDTIIEVGNRIYVRASVFLHNCDNQDDVICVEAYAREEDVKKGMDGSQITGAASSYARKYALNGMFAIDDTKDSDATNDHGKGQPQKPVQQQVKAKVNPKYIKAWKEYTSLDGCKGVANEQLKANFKKLCADTVGNANASAYGDAEWDKVLETIDAMRAI